MKKPIMPWAVLAVFVVCTGVLIQAGLSKEATDIGLQRVENVGAGARESKDQILASENMPASLAGVEYRIQFALAEDRSLVPSYAIREMFDFYLSTLGEVELEGALALIRAEIDRGLTGSAKSEALALLKRYVDYKIALAELEHGSNRQPGDKIGTYQELARIQSEIIAIRQQYFDSEESANFFATEDLQTDFMLEQVRINNDPALSATEREQMLGQASLLLPTEVRESRRRAQVHAELRGRVEALRASGASDEKVYQLRASQLGTDAAVSLAELDRNRKQWEIRIKQFSTERASILNSGLSEQDKVAAIENLLTAGFSGAEKKRARALVAEGRLN